MIWRYVPPPELALFSFDQDGDGWPEISGCNVEFIQKAIIATSYTTTYAKEVSEYFHGKYDEDTHRKVSSGDYPSLHPAYLKHFLDEKAKSGDGTTRDSPEIIKIGRIILASDGMYW